MPAMTTTEDDVLAADELRYRAMVDGDLATLDQLCAEELSYAHSNGARDTKAEYFAKLRSGYYVYHRIDHPVERVAVTGETAVVIGRMTADIHAGGVAKTIDNLALAVWTRASGSWQLLAYAPTPLPG
jgi:ketosteroid isomerase-like protein